MKLIIAVSALVAVLAAGTAQAQDCALSAGDMDTFEALDYDAFNYGPDGWRKLAAKDCYFEAGASIVSWLVDHQNTMSADEQRTQHYQAARNFALAGHKPVALTQLRMARMPGSGQSSTMNWNAFLDAFAAWLSSDKKALDTALERLQQQQPGVDGRKPNLAAAWRFARCWERSYMEIEQNPDCLAGPKQENRP